MDMNHSDSSDDGYQFTNSWFAQSAKKTWDELVPQVDPRRVLEIGCYEGASTCYLIDSICERHELELHCVDNWRGGQEHHNQVVNMADVEARFMTNSALAVSKAKNAIQLVVHKGDSSDELAKLLSSGKRGYFDLIYIDGSHEAADVLCDAVLSYHLLRVDGVIIFDDYLWVESYAKKVDPLDCPKLAIDAFTNIHCRGTRIIPGPLFQLYVQKIGP
jgi:predicted O-methyltransferase YrrM